MRVGRTLSPAAADAGFHDLLNGLGAFFDKSGRQDLEEEIKNYFDVKHAFLVSSGKAALYLILLAVKSLSTKRKVLIPAYTCFSVPSAVGKADLSISLCDIDKKTFDFDHRYLEEVIDDDTGCIVVNNLFGFPSDIGKVRNLCRGKEIFVVEDAAQSMGVLCDGMQLGVRGDAGFFSLGRGKNITCGGGGIIVTNSDSIAGVIEGYFSSLESPGLIESMVDYAKMLAMAIFVHPSLYWIPAGFSFLRLGETIFHEDFPIKKLSRTASGIMARWRQRLEESNRIRRDNVNYFCERIAVNYRFDCSIPLLRLPVLAPSKEKRDRIYAISLEKGLGISRMYPTPVNEISQIRSCFNGMEFRSAKLVSETILTLPTHRYLSERDKESICRLLNSN